MFGSVSLIHGRSPLWDWIPWSGPSLEHLPRKYEIGEGPGQKKKNYAPEGVIRISPYLPLVPVRLRRRGTARFRQPQLLRRLTGRLTGGTHLPFARDHGCARCRRRSGCHPL